MKYYKDVLHKNKPRSCLVICRWGYKPRNGKTLTVTQKSGRRRFGYGLGVERFEQFRFSVPAVPLQKGFVCVSFSTD